MRHLFASAVTAVSLAALAACGSSPSTSSGSGGSSFCQQAQQVSTALNGLTQSVSGGTSTPTVATFQQLIREAAQAFDNLDSQAPSQIASAFHHLRTVLDQAAQQVQSATTLDQAQTALSGLSDSTVQTDSTTVNSYMNNTCHITEAPSTAASPT